MHNIGDYRIIRELGRGITAIVYLGEDSKKNKYAIKVLYPLSVNKKTISLLKREQRINQKIFNRYIIRVEDYKLLKSDDGNLYHCLIMEYMPGQNLSEFLDKRKKLPIHMILKIAWQVCHALADAHSKQIFHHDIKPQNIIIDKDINVKITDFGFASRLNPSIHTIPLFGGTADYISPERANGYQGDARSDLYSLGIVMHELITGAVPSRVGNTTVLSQTNINAETTSIRKLRSDIPHKLSIIVHKSIEKDPDNRFYSAQEMLDVIEMIANEEGVDLSSISVNSVKIKKRNILFEWSLARWYDVITNLIASMIWWIIGIITPALLILLGINTVFSANKSNIVLNVPSTTITAVITNTSGLIAHSSPQTAQLTFQTTSPTIETGSLSTQLPVPSIQTTSPAIPTTLSDTPTNSVVPPSPTPNISVVPPSPTPNIKADAIVASSIINLREGPSVAFSIMARYSHGTILKVLGKDTTTTWIKVRLPDKREGWMSISGVDLKIDLSSIPFTSSPPRPTTTMRPTSIPSANVPILPSATNMPPTPVPPTPVPPTPIPPTPVISRINGFWEGRVTQPGETREQPILWMNIKDNKIVTLDIAFWPGSCDLMRGHVNNNLQVPIVNNTFSLKDKIGDSHAYTSISMNGTFDGKGNAFGNATIRVGGYCGAGTYTMTWSAIWQHE